MLNLLLLIISSEWISSTIAFHFLLYFALALILIHKIDWNYRRAMLNRQGCSDSRLDQHRIFLTENESRLQLHCMRRKALGERECAPLLQLKTKRIELHEGNY
jgi:hypothetical protein